MHVIFAKDLVLCQEATSNGVVASAQVNGRVGKGGGLLGAGVLTQHVWVMADDNGIKCGWKGRDKGMRRSAPPLDPGVNASCSELTAIVSSQNADILLNVVRSSAISISIQLHSR